MKAPPMPVAAIAVTDKTCLPVLGLNWRTLRRWCRERGVAIHRVGRRPLVRIDDFVRALGGEQPAVAVSDEAVVDLAMRRRAAP